MIKGKIMVKAFKLDYILQIILDKKYNKILNCAFLLRLWYEKKSIPIDKTVSAQWRDTRGKGD